jgi:hypothetical protein
MLHAITEVTSWTANILVAASFLLISLGIIKGDKKAYNWSTLVVVLLYSLYSYERMIIPMLELNIAYILISTKKLYILHTDPDLKKQHFKIPFKAFLAILITTSIITTKVIGISTPNPLIIIGGMIFLTAYALVSSGKIQGDRVAFNIMSLIGAILYGVFAWIENETQVFVLEIVLAFIAISTLTKIAWRKKMRLGLWAIAFPPLSAICIEVMIIPIAMGWARNPFNPAIPDVVIRFGFSAIAILLPITIYFLLRHMWKEENGHS